METEHSRVKRQTILRKILLEIEPELSEALIARILHTNNNLTDVFVAYNLPLKVAAVAAGQVTLAEFLQPRWERFAAKKEVTSEFEYKIALCVDIMSAIAEEMGITRELVAADCEAITNDFDLSYEQFAYLAFLHLRKELTK